MIRRALVAFAALSHVSACTTLAISPPEARRPSTITVVTPEGRAPIVVVAGASKVGHRAGQGATWGSLVPGAVTLIALGPLGLLGVAAAGGVMLVGGAAGAAIGAAAGAAEDANAGRGDERNRAQQLVDGSALRNLEVLSNSALRDCVETELEGEKPGARKGERGRLEVEWVALELHEAGFGPLPQRSYRMALTGSYYYRAEGRSAKVRGRAHGWTPVRPLAEWTSQAEPAASDLANACNAAAQGILAAIGS